MWAATIVLILAAVVLSLAMTEILGVIDGNETALGMPAGFTGIQFLLGFVFTLVSVTTLLAPFAVIYQRRRSKRR